MLRKAGEAAATNTRRITLGDLPKPEMATDDRFSTISVVRGGQKFEYTVPTEDENYHALASAKARSR